MNPLENPSPREPEENEKNSSLHTGVIVLITVLACLVLFLSVILVLFAKKTASIDRQVSQLEETVQNISQLSQELNETSQTQTTADTDADASASEDSAQASQETDASASEPQEEGTLSPSSGGETKVISGDLTDLQSQLQTQVDELNATDGTWAIYTENLNTGASCSVGDSQMQAASLIKLFIMGAVYEDYDAVCSAGGGRETVNSALTSMITVSDNDAANNLVTWLGGGDASSGMAAVNSFCENHGYSSTHMGRLLLASNASDDNYTSVSDCGKILQEIYSGSDSLAYPDLMYSLLQKQERRNKIPAGIPAIDGAQVANKTGELDTVENDAAIIFSAPRNDFVLCIMSQNLSDTAQAQAVIQNLSNMIYGYFNQ